MRMLVKLKSRYACPEGNYRTGEVIAVEEKIAKALEKEGSEIVGKVEEEKECAAVEPPEKAVMSKPRKRTYNRTSKG